MAGAYSQLYVHLIWTTWNREPWIGASVESPLYQAIRRKVKELGSEAYAVGGMPDHVHVLLRFNPARSISQHVKEIKGSTSYYVNNELKPGFLFRWQGGYGAFTVSKEDVEEVRKYVQHQKHRHAAMTLRSEWEAGEIKE